MAKILLVEDDAPLKRLYASALALEHDVLAVESSAEAVRAIDEGRPDLVVLDLNLPDAPGTTILEYIESHPDLSHLQVIIITGFPHHKRNALADFVIEILNKPVTTTMLMQVVKAATATNVNL